MFKKRIFTLKTFAEGLAGLILGLPGTVGARVHKGITHAFAEKLRLSTTSVNGCVYCSYTHTMLAIRAGISGEEIGLLLKGDLGCEVDSSETPGLIFAQHYAETGGNPDTVMLEKLESAYGGRLSRDILALVREIEFANLNGNTFEAFLSRMRGNAAPGSSPLFEALFFLVNLPILGPLHLIMKMKK